MELDWKLIIALVALAISIYNLLDNKRMYKIEKKTIVLNELMEAQLLLTRVHDVFIDINKIQPAECMDEKLEILECKNETEDLIEKLNYIFEKIISSDKYDKNFLETCRPLIHKINISAQTTYRKEKELLQKITKDSLNT